MKNLIYLDNAATTKTRPEVVEAMLPYFTEFYGNPSSVYEFSAPVKEAVTRAREVIGASIGTRKEDIDFTSGGSEADNWAIKAAADAYKRESTSLPVKLSIMQCCTPVSIWSRRALR